MSEANKKPYKNFYLDVSDLHKVHVRLYGNPNGLPCVFLHGGPGGGCSDSDGVFFDLEKWHLITFDQRGCGQSLPHAELRSNTTWDLVADIEKIRLFLGIAQWAVFGGSWGSSLSLAYSQTYPEVVSALFLRGIFLCSPSEVRWFYEGEGSNFFFPKEYEDFCKPIANVVGASNIEKYYSLLTCEDVVIRKSAAKVWSTYEGRLSALNVDPKKVATFGEDKFADAFARIECHYFLNNSFFNKKNALLNNMEKISQIPTFIVHGRYDVICAVKWAYRVHELLPKSLLFVSPTSGHSSRERETRNKLLSLTTEFVNRQKAT